MNNHHAYSRQAGVILFIALVILIFMSLAGVAMMRVIDVGSDIAGNFASRSASLTASDRGVEQARTWVAANQGTLTVTNVTLLTDNATNGYKASRRADASGHDVNFFDSTTWSDAPVVKMPGISAEADTQGNRVQYLIDRQCSRTGNIGVQVDNANGNSTGQYNYCLNNTPVSNLDPGGCSDGNDCGSGGAGVGTAPILTYYRVVVRTTGPRNTVSYVQALLAQQIPSGSGG